MDETKTKNAIEFATRMAAEAEEKYRLAVFGQVLNRQLQEAAMPSSTAPSPAQHYVVGKQLNEFLARVKCKTDRDRVLAILYFNFKQGLLQLTAKEIADEFGRARTKKPANLSDVLGKSIGKGYVVIAPELKDGQKAWQITGFGEEYVETLIPQATGSQ